MTHPARLSFAALALAALVPSAASAFQATPTASAGIESEVQAILDHPRVQEAFAHLVDTDDQTMADLRELTQIPAPPFMEEVRGQRFAEMLTEVGVDSVWTDDEGNVIGMRRGRGTGTIVIAG